MKSGAVAVGFPELVSGKGGGVTPEKSVKSGAFAVGFPEPVPGKGGGVTPDISPESVSLPDFPRDTGEGACAPPMEGISSPELPAMGIPPGAAVTSWGDS